MIRSVLVTVLGQDTGKNPGGLHLPAGSVTPALGTLYIRQVRHIICSVRGVKLSTRGADGL
jgi:hypothetical protein